MPENLPVHDGQKSPIQLSEMKKTEVSSSTFKRYQFDQIFLLKILYSSKLFIYIDKARNLTFLIRINALKEYA